MRGLAPAAAIGRAPQVPFDRRALLLDVAGVLVRTDKYRAGDDDRFEPRPALVVGSVADLPDLLS